MKIVYCVPAVFNSGGIERVLSIKANYLSDIMHWDVIIVTTSQKGRPNYYNFSSNIHFYDLGINYDELEGMPMLTKIKQTILKKKKHKCELSRLLDDLKADVVVSMFTHESSFLYDIKDGSKKVLEIHFSRYYRLLDDRANHAHFCKRLISYYLNFRDFKKVSSYDKFIVLTEKDKLSWKGVKNIEVIYNPMTFQSTQLANIDSKKIIGVGRLCKQKGFMSLLDIWNNIPIEKKTGWKVAIYGKGPDYRELTNKIYEYGLQDSVTIFPPVVDIQSVYLDTSIFCFTSNYEGFGMALIEGMSCGTPAISFDCPCGPSEIIQDGIDGFLVAEGDVHEFTKRLICLMESRELRVKFGQMAFLNTKKTFGVEVIMKKWVDLFNRLQS